MRKTNFLCVFKIEEKQSRNQEKNRIIKTYLSFSLFVALQISLILIMNVTLHCFKLIRRHSLVSLT